MTGGGVDSGAHSGRVRRRELIDEARSINSSLRHVGQHLRVGVMQTESAASVLQHDGATISGALQVHKHELKSALHSTDKRLSRIKNAAARERLFLTLSLVFFSLTVAYILAKRLGLLRLLMLSATHYSDSYATDEC